MPNDVPKDILSGTDTLKTNSSLYPAITENQLDVYSNKKLGALVGTLGALEGTLGALRWFPPCQMLASYYVEN